MPSSFCKQSERLKNVFTRTFYYYLPLTSPTIIFSFKDPTALLCKWIAEANFQTQLASDPSKPSQQVQYWNFLPVADKYAARYEQALSKERTSETETLVNQRDLHTRPKDTDLEKYGSVTELRDALVGGTHVHTLQLTFEDTSAGPPFSIFKQCNDRVLKLYRVHQVRTWLLSFNIQMPQLPLLVARLFEQQLITLANAADQFDSEAKVRAEKFSALDKSP